MARPRNQPLDVFKYIDMPESGDPEPCWEWTGSVGGRSTDQRGYFSVGGVKWLAYRLVYTLVYGDLGEGVVVRHMCDNSMCCNPYHLEKGTQSQNEQDKYDRDRYGFPIKVIENILKWSEKGMPQDAVAQLVTETHGIVVTQQRVSDIVSGARRKRQTDKINSALNNKRKGV